MEKYRTSRRNRKKQPLTPEQDRKRSEQELALVQREKKLAAFRREQRERDLYCGDGVSGGRFWQKHGFDRDRADIGPVATADLKTGKLSRQLPDADQTGTESAPGQMP